MKIALASDHAGFELKEAIKGFLLDHEIVDYGTFNKQPADYPDTGFLAARAVSRGECDKGILICGSGIGMSIVANKVKGIRAALCDNIQVAALASAHNNANVLVLPGRFIATWLAGQIIKAWLETPFAGERHQKRLNKISENE